MTQHCHVCVRVLYHVINTPVSFLWCGMWMRCVLRYLSWFVTTVVVQDFSTKARLPIYLRFLRYYWLKFHCWDWLLGAAFCWTIKRLYSPYCIWLVRTFTSYFADSEDSEIAQWTVKQLEWKATSRFLDWIVGWASGQTCLAFASDSRAPWNMTRSNSMVCKSLSRNSGKRSCFKRSLEHQMNSHLR